MKRDGGDSPRWRCGRFHYKIFLKHPAIGFYNSTKRKKIDLWPNGRSKSSQGSSKLFNLGRFWFVTAAAPSKKRNSNGGVLDHIMDGYLFFCLLSWHLIRQYECFVLIENIFFTQESHCEHFCLNLRPSRVVVVAIFWHVEEGVTCGFLYMVYTF